MAEDSYTEDVMDTWIVIADGPDYDAPEAYGPFTEGMVAQRFSNGLLSTLELESGEGRVHTYVTRLREARP